jgi:hypothetical protein
VAPRLTLIRVLAALVTLLAFTACAPTPTPLPAFIPPTPTVPPISPTPAPLRYAITQASVGLVPDLDAIAKLAKVIPLEAPVEPQDLGQKYDVIAGYGTRENWTVSPTLLHVALIVNIARSPLDQAAASTVIRRAIDPQALITAIGLPGIQPAALQPIAIKDARVTLANAGLPDGFDVRVGTQPIPGAQAVADAFKDVQIGAVVEPMTADSLSATLDAAAPHLLVVGWTNDTDRQTWIARAGEANVIELYTVPISYLAVQGLTITYAPGGFPLPKR